MLDPLTAISLASSVVQFTEFGIRLVTGTIELYYSADGANTERSSLEFRITQVRNLANQVMYPLEHNDDDRSPSRHGQVLRELVASCKEIASDLLLVLDNLKVKRPAGPGRKLESFRKAIAAQTPWNKDKIASLDKRLRGVKEAMFDQIQLMMR